MEYSQLSKDLTSSLDKKTKKDGGIFFTPPSTVQKTLDVLEPYMNNIQTILEPSCGSGEYLKALDGSGEITGIELNKEIYDSIKNNFKNILNENFLSFDFKEKVFDLVIGNPPYYVMKKTEVDKKYLKYFDGRPNIFILFIIKSLELLSEHGILSFVLPKNFLNCLYYDKTRKFINKNFKIIDIIDCKKDKYLETQQDTIVLIVQKSESRCNSDYVMKLKENTIFGTKNTIKELKKLCKNKSSLEELDFKVSVGNVVWNQVKDKLTDDESKTRLIYSSDIVNNNLVLKKYKNDEKKNFIDKKGSTEPILVVNRGYGVGDYNFSYCLIEGGGQEYLIENHLICIKYTGESENEIEKYNELVEKLNHPDTKKFIDLYFGNNAINTTELRIIPF